MKQFIAMLLALSMIWTLSACGTSTAPVSSEEQSTAVSSAESSAQEVNTITVDMIYSEKCENKENYITAFCYTDEGIRLLGEDDYTVYLGEAAIYNVQGEEITVDDFTVGCPIQIQCEDQVYASMPPLLHAWTVTVLSEEAIADY